MSGQPSLFPPPPADGGLTPRQQRVLDALQEQGPLTTLEAGKVAHQDKHGGGACSWCEDAGREVTQALRKRGLIKRTRGDVWIPNGASSQGDFPPGF